jgi:chitodextrinase
VPRRSPRKPLRVTLSWGAAADDVGVAGYRIYRSDALIATTASLSYVDPAVEGRTSYRYEVRAVDAAGNVGPAASATVKTPPA